MGYPVSARFLAALASNVQVVSTIDIVVDGVVVSSGIPGISAAVTVEANQAVRRHGTLVVDGWRDDLDPYGTEVAISSGFAYAAGDVEMVPMGVFGVEQPEGSDDGLNLATGCEIYDRARSIQARRLAVPYPIAAGTNVGDAIQALIDSRRPGLTYSFQSTSATTPDVLLAEQADPWAEAQQLAAAAGMEIFFDPTGICVLRTIVAVDAGNVDWRYIEGEGCQLTKLGKKRTSEGVYSHAIATGETTDNTAPVRGDAYDIDASSPTYHLGRFGDRPTWLRSPYIRTQPQADDAAVGLLNRTSGIAEGLTLEAVANPAADADDTALVQRARLEIDAVYTLDALTNTLGPDGTLQASTRTRRIA